MPNDAGIAAQIDRLRETAGSFAGADGCEDAEACAAVAEWPAAFTCGPSGVWYVPPAAKDEDEPKPMFVCGPFSVVAETLDVHGGSWGLLLHWEDRDKRPHDWAMPRRLLHDAGNLIAAELEHAGLSVGTGKRSHDLLKQLLGQIRTAARRRCVDRTGWHQTDHGHVYVLPGGETYGATCSEVILQTDRVAASEAVFPRGTLAEWQDNVARFAVGNHRLGLFLAAAFAGPLLEVTSEPSGGLHLHGSSQTGKTTLLASATSVWGRGDTSGQVRTWRATSNGMEGVASETCDALLPLDEIGQVDPREAGEIVYQLANESGKARASRDGSARLRRTWRIVFLSTGEVPLSVKMGERGASPMAGQEVRLANLPADAGAGLGVFQSLHGFSSADKVASRLREASRAYYGTAARAFLARLADERTRDAVGLASLIEAMRSAFVKEHMPAGADGQVISVARRFSLFAAAGELARLWGVLNWPEGEAVSACASGLAAWIAARGGVGAGEDAHAIATVRRFIEAHEESRFTLLVHGPAGSAPPRNRFDECLDTVRAGEPADDGETREGRPTIHRVGYRRQTGAGWQFLIFPESWKGELCKGLDPARAAAALHAAGYLEKGESSNWSKKHRVPGLGAARFYTVSGNILQGDATDRDTDVAW